MKAILLTVILLALLDSACKTSIKPIPAPNGNENCQMIPINQRIIGQWKFNSNFTGSHQSRYLGTITFNQDGSLLDTDSLLGSGSKDAPVLKKLYNVKGDTLWLVTVTSKDTIVVRGVVTTRECNQLVFGSWFYLAPSPGLTLTLIKP